MAYKSLGNHLEVVGQWVNANREGTGLEGRCELLCGKQYGTFSNRLTPPPYSIITDCRRRNSKRMKAFMMISTSTKKKRNSVLQLTMTMTLVNRKQPATVSFVPQYQSTIGSCNWLDLPPRTPSKKHDKDEESVTSSKRDSSPVLKKAHATAQLRKSSLAADSMEHNFISLEVSLILPLNSKTSTTSKLCAATNGKYTQSRSTYPSTGFTTFITSNTIRRGRGGASQPFASNTPDTVTSGIKSSAISAYSAVNNNNIFCC